MSRAEAFDILGDCLGLHFGTGHLTGTRLKLYAQPGLWTPLFELAHASGLLPALESAVARCGLLPVSALQRDAVGPADALGRIKTDHDARRLRMRARLEEIVADLGRHGIETLLIKGAASLWTGTPHWRTMRDLDIVVPRHLADTAQSRLVAAGYRPAPDGERRPHHLETMVRDDLPGWIELHVAASNARGERMLPTSAVLQHAVQAGDGRSRVRLPHPAAHVLHGLVHHHFANRGAAYGVIAPKGLIEFAHGYAALDARGVELLRRLAARHARLEAAVDLWIAAGADFLRIADRPRFRPLPDAARRWAAIHARMREDAACSLAAAAGEDLRMALCGPRLGAAVAAGGHRSTPAAALHALRTFLSEAPSTPRRRAEARQRAAGVIAPATPSPG